MAAQKKDSHPENISEPDVGAVKGGVPPTADEPSEAAKVLQEQVPDTAPDPKSQGGEFNPTTPDGSPPPNNLPGPHGPQGVEHLQADPGEAGDSK